MTNATGSSATRTVVPVTTNEDDITEDFPHVREFQYVLIYMPSGNVKMVNLKPKT